MRTVIFLFSLLVVTGNIFSQSSYNSYRGALSDLYFNMQPAPKSEAMGRGLSANSEGDFGAYYNPALTGLVHGVKFNLSFTNLQRNNQGYNFISVAFELKNIGSFAISKYNYGVGINEDGDADYHNSIHTLNYSREVCKDFYAGLNLNLVHMGYLKPYDTMFEYGSYYEKSSDAFSFDVGVLKRFQFNGSENSENTFSLGAALYNPLGLGIKNKNILNEDFKESLPVILRTGISYNHILRKGKNDSKLMQSLTHIECEGILNSSENPVVKVGEELTVFDFLILRGGVSSLGSYAYRTLSDLVVTYGLGIKAGFNKLFNKSDRIEFGIDYAGTPPAFISSYFNIFSVKINYLPKL